MELKRVVVTGLGAITPIGNTVPEVWDSAVKGVSGAAPITHFDASKFKTQFACEVKGFRAEDYIDPKEARKMDLFCQYSVAAAKQALEDSGMDLSKEDLEKWSKYDKAKGLKRQYPVNAEKFEQWVRLDFDGDGDIKYSSPFQLRAELMEKQFDFSNETDRFKLGRALYHIAQRRGFRSSKGETIKEQEQAADEKEFFDVVVLISSTSF